MLKGGMRGVFTNQSSENDRYGLRIQNSSAQSGRTGLFLSNLRSDAVNIGEGNGNNIMAPMSRVKGGSVCVLLYIIILGQHHHPKIQSSKEAFYFVYQFCRPCSTTVAKYPDMIPELQDVSIPGR